MIGTEEVPKFVVFVQPILLIVAISVYTIAIGVTKLLNENDSEEADTDSRISSDAPPPLVISQKKSTKPDFSGRKPRICSN